MSQPEIVTFPFTPRRSRSVRTGPPSIPYTDRLRAACREGMEERRPLRPDWCPWCKGFDTVGQNLTFRAGRAGQFSHYCKRCPEVWYPPQSRPSREQLRRIEAIRTADGDELYARQLDTEINGTPPLVRKTRKRKHTAAGQCDDEAVPVNEAQTTFSDGSQPPTKKSKKGRALGAVNRALDKMSTVFARQQEKPPRTSTVVERALAAAAKASNNPHTSGAEYGGLDLLRTFPNKKVVVSGAIKAASIDQGAKDLHVLLSTNKTGAVRSHSTQAGSGNVSAAAGQRGSQSREEFTANVRAGYPRPHPEPYRDGEDRGNDREGQEGQGGGGEGGGRAARQNTLDVRVVFWTEHRSRPKIVRARMGIGELRLADYPALMDHLGLDADTQWDWWLEGPQTWRANMVVTDPFYVSFEARTVLGRVQLRDPNDGGRFQGVVGLMDFGVEVDRIRDGMYGIELDLDEQVIPDLDEAGNLRYDLC